MITNKLIKRTERLYSPALIVHALNVTFQVFRNASWKHCQEWQIELPSMTISLLLWLLFFHCSKSNEEEDFRKAIQLYENDTTHRTKRGTKGQTSQVIDMQLCRLSITWYRIGCRKRTLIFRSFISGFDALDFTDFARIQMFTIGRKVEIVSFVIRFYGII